MSKACGIRKSTLSLTCPEFDRIDAAMAATEEARELKRARLEPEDQPELLSDLVADAAEDDLTVHQRVEEQREQISAALAQVEQIQRKLEQVGVDFYRTLPGS